MFIKHVLVCARHGKDVRQFSQEGRKETEGVAILRDILEGRLKEIKRAKTWKHERILTSPQDTKVWTRI